MTRYYYDIMTDTVRRYGHLTTGDHIGERFDKKTKDWSTECCPESGCIKWDERLSEEAANQIIARQTF